MVKRIEGAKVNGAQMFTVLTTNKEWEAIKEVIKAACKGKGAQLNLSLIHISEPTRPY